MELKRVKEADVTTVWPLLSELYYDHCLDAIIHGFHGQMYTDDTLNPQMVMAHLGWNLYIAGNPYHDQVDSLLKAIRPPCEIHAKDTWLPVLNTHFKNRVTLKTRYQMDGSTLSEAHLKKLTQTLPKPYTIKKIDAKLYQRILSDEPWASGFVENFKDVNDFLNHGLGFVVLDGDTIIGGTASYARFNGGYEIEIITKEGYRKQGIAKASGAHFILETLKQGKNPHWDAAHQASKTLAESLGYQLDRVYTVYAIEA